MRAFVARDHALHDPIRAHRRSHTSALREPETCTCNSGGLEGRHDLEMGDFETIGASVGALSLHTAVVMEGGYDIDATAGGVRRFLGAAAN